MRNTHTTKEPVVLEGYQAIFNPGQYGFKLEALLPGSIIEALEAEREEQLKWCLSKAKNPRRAVQKPEPWEIVDEGRDLYKLRFTWKEDQVVPIFDTKGVLIKDKLDVRAGSTVKLNFYQKPYILPDNSYGTSVKLNAIQLVTINAGAGVDTGDLSVDDLAKLFGTCDGFTASEPNVSPAAEEDDEF